MDINDLEDQIYSEVLNINLAMELTKMQKKEFAYLQLVRPSWMTEEDKLLNQLKSLSTLYSKGKIVWAALVQANKALFDNGPDSCPAEVVYDPSGKTPVHELERAARKLFSLKHTEPEEPELAEYAKHITNERARQCFKVPPLISDRGLLTTVIFLWRFHLPNGKLTMPVIPILIDDRNEGVVTLLPANFWRHTYFYRQWQRDNNNIDTTAAFKVLNQNGSFWKSIDHIYPKINELPSFGQSAIYHREMTEEANKESLKYIKRCRNVVYSDFFMRKKEMTSERPLTPLKSKSYKQHIFIALCICLCIIYVLFKVI